MKRTSSLIPLLLLALSAQPALAQSGYDLFQQALVKERAEGNAEEALALYERVGKEYAQNRELAARALLQKGLLYEKLGRQKEAQQAFQLVMSQYADQAEVVKQARARIKPAPASKAEPVLSVRQVWADDPMVDIMGDPSPDGRYLSFVDWKTGDLAVRDLSTGTNRHLTNKGSWSESEEQAHFSIFAPDGRQIAFNWLAKDEFFELRTIGLDGTNLRVVYRNEALAYIHPFDWSQDGKHILALVTRNDGTNQLVLVSMDDGSVRTLKSLEWRYPQKARLSPDGKFIAYDVPEELGAVERDIYLLATDASRETVLVKHPANDFLLGWTPDGKNILFASDRSGSTGAWMITVQDGNAQGQPELVRPAIGNVWPLGFSRNGSYYYALAKGTRNVHLATIDHESGRIVTDLAPLSQRFMGSNWMPRWSPDGKAVAFLRTHSGMPFISRVFVIHDLDTGAERELVPRMGYIRNFRWSLDKQAFLVSGKDARNREGFFRVDAQTGEVSPILLGEPRINILDPNWSKDGKTLFYKRFDANTKQASLIRQDLESGQEAVLLQEGLCPGIMSWVSLSPDEQQLFFVECEPDRNNQKFTLMPAAGGETRELFRITLDDKEWLNSPAWTPDGRYIYFFKLIHGGQSSEMWRVKVATGASTTMPLDKQSRLELSFHPDGNRFAFRTEGEGSSIEIWAMENFLPTVQARSASQPGR